MKFIHMLPILGGAAALAALQPAVTSNLELAPGGWIAGVLGGSAPAAAAAPPVTPPWLTNEWQERAPEAEDADPHANVCNGLGVTADDGSDPHAELCAGGQAAVHTAHVHDLGSDDPHAEVHDTADPHAGLYDDPTDPHAGLEADAPPVIYEAAHVDPPAAPVDASKAPNGKRVAQVFAERSALDQERVSVRGVVVKLMEGILGKTYLHLQDGSGSAEGGDNDLTLTTTQTFSLGETVEVEGLLVIDQDVGAGYSYPALLTEVTRVSR